MALLNITRAQTVLREQALDAVIATTPENLFYLTEIEHPTLLNAGLSAAAILVAPDAIVSAVILPQVSAGWALDLAVRIQDVFLYGDVGIVHGARSLRDEEQILLALLEDSARNFVDFYSALITAVETIGLSGKRVAFDDPAVAAEVGSALAGLRGISAPKVLPEVRYVKTEDEISRLRTAAEVAEDVEMELICQATSGVTWLELVDTYRTQTVVRGADLGFLSGGAGWRGAFIYPPDDRRFQLGDVVRVDLGVIWNRYWADTGRTVAIGEPSLDTHQRYDALRSGLEAMVAEVRPGVTLEHLYDTGMSAVRNSIPDYKRHHCGHTIGLRPSDGERVAPGSKTRLEPGVVLNLEVPLFELGWGGMQIEDTVLVTHHGYERLTRLSRDLVVR